MVQRAVSVDLDWSSSLDTPVMYANELQIHSFRDEFILAIGQFDIPSDVPDENGVPSIPVRVVAKIALTPTRFRAFADAMSRIADTIGDQPDDTGPMTAVSPAGESPEGEN